MYFCTYFFGMLILNIPQSNCILPLSDCKCQPQSILQIGALDPRYMLCQPMLHPEGILAWNSLQNLHSIHSNSYRCLGYSYRDRNSHWDINNLQS